MSESKLSGTVCAIIKTAGGHVSRVEAAASAAGIPDINFCVGGVEGNIELKYGHNKKKPELRASQVRWFRGRIKAGGRPFFLLLDGDMDIVYLVEGTHYGKLAGHKTVKLWATYSYEQWEWGDEFKQRLIEHIKRRN